MSDDIKVYDYSAASVVVVGKDTRKYKEQLKKIGFWNSRLKTGQKGWIVRKASLPKLTSIIGKYTVENNPATQQINAVANAQSEFEKEFGLESTASSLAPPSELPSSKNALKQIDHFCSELKKNKVRDTRILFYRLPQEAQEVFLKYGFKILSHPEKYSEESYLTAFLLFKLFRNESMKAMSVYKKYNTDRVEKVYAAARKKMGGKGKSSTSSSSSSSSRSSYSSRSRSRGARKVVKESKKYDKDYQRKPEPEQGSAYYRFYVSLYQEHPDSPLAITWLTEHGVFDGAERQAIVDKYEKLAKEDHIIR